jgi:hypothetical protein
MSVRNGLVGRLALYSSQLFRPVFTSTEGRSRRERHNSASCAQILEQMKIGNRGH